MLADYINPEIGDVVKFGAEEKDRAKKLLATTIQIAATVIANGMRIMPGSIFLVLALTMHFDSELFKIVDEKHAFFIIQAILWQGVVMAFSLAIFDAGARTFIKRNGKNVQL